MGCCASIEATPNSREEQSLNVGSKEASKLRGFSHESRAPPPSAEEETVKEVLSETSKPKPKPKPKLEEEQNIAANLKQEEVEETKPAFFAKIQENQQEQKQQKMKKSENVEKKQDLNANNEEVMSEVSEIFSLSLSESVSTTTDKRDNEVEQEVRRQRASRSPAKLPPQRNQDYVAKRDRVVAQSPTRRPEQSPGRRNNINGSSVRLVQSRREEAIRATRREKRDPGESSGRRSRSPATTRSAAMGRSPSARRTNRSPGRVKTDPAENGSSNNSLRKMEGRWQHSNNNNSNSNNSSTNESLENPLVSLECFIFL